MDIKYNYKTIGFLLDQMQYLSKMFPMRTPCWQSKEEWRKDVRCMIRHLRQASKILQRHTRFNIHTFYNAEDAKGLTADVCGATHEFFERWTVHKHVTVRLNENDALEDTKAFSQCLKYIMDDQGRTEIPAGFSDGSRQEWLHVRNQFQMERNRMKTLTEVPIRRCLG